MDNKKIVKSLEEKGLHMPTNLAVVSQLFSSLSLEVNIKIGLLLEYMDNRDMPAQNRIAVKRVLEELIEKNSTTSNIQKYKIELTKLIDKTDIITNYSSYFNM